MEPLFATRRAAAEMLGVSVGTVDRLAAEDADFPRARKLRDGGVQMYLTEELKAYAESRPLYAEASA